MSAVYVLHFDPPLGHARHYIGFTDRNVGARLQDHLTGRGNPLVKAAVAAGSTVFLAHVFEHGTRTFERSLKNRADVGRWCPLCGRHSRPLPRLTFNGGNDAEPR